MLDWLDDNDDEYDVEADLRQSAADFEQACRVRVMLERALDRGHEVAAACCKRLLKAIEEE